MAILALPLVGVVFIVIAYTVTFGMGMQGRPATGAPVALSFAGCPEAGPVIAARLVDMGLEPSPAGDPLAFRVALPDDPEVAARIPDTLTTPGRLRILGDGAELAGPQDIADASVRMDLMMVPSTLIHLGEAAANRVRDHVRANPTGRLTFELDGSPIGTQSNREPVEVGEVEIDPEIGDGRERWAAVAAWSVVVDHPLPCEITPASPAGGG